MAVASAGPYASLHLAPDRQPCQHPTTLFLQAGCPSCHPTNSVKALKAKTHSQRSKIYTVVKIAQGNCRTSHCRNCEKSTCSTDCLNRGNEEKSALAGSEFHTLAICSVKKFRCFEFSHGFIHLVWMPS